MNILYGMLCGFVCVLAGVAMVTDPEKTWALKHFWSVRDGEPSKLFLISCRIGGVLAILVGVVGTVLLLFQY